MRRIGWFATGLALLAFVAIAAAATTAESAKPKAEVRKTGVGPAYEALGKLAVLHEGRIKPFDTLAREEVKQIYGRETVKLLDDDNEPFESWGPVAALYDWSVRPEFWDDQPVILVEYLPLKRMILADSIGARLASVAGRESTTAADRASLLRLVSDKDLSAAKVSAFLKTAKLNTDDRTALKTVAVELAESHKWLSPHQLEEARVTNAEGERLPFDKWFRGVVAKRQQAENSADGALKLTDVEKRGYEVGTRLAHYQSVRDRALGVEPLRMMPRPNDKAYLAFLAQTLEKFRKGAGRDDFSPFELDGAKALETYWNELPGDEREIPGTKAEFDGPFADWLRRASAWVPLKAVLDTKPNVLAAAGFPLEKVEAFQKAFKDLDRAEDAAPGTVAPAKTEALVASARSLGTSVNPEMYPSVAAVDREVYFNETNPFWKAPMAYGLAVALLAASLGFLGFEKKTFASQAGRVIYGLGVLGLLTGIALETNGFYLRVLISGWAPVTNMYETVIWVSLVAAVLGLVLEGIYRKTYAALAGSMVALLGTVLAANVPLLDPDIKQLQPVLRSNYWLTIHVLTEVSSYGAFMQAAFLGLIATVYYLTATYRRSATYTELALPVVPGLPLLAVGSIGVLATYGFLGPRWELGDVAYMVFGATAGVGGVLTLVAALGMLGEAVSRFTFRNDVRLNEAAIAGEAGSEHEHEEAATAVASARSASASASAGSGAGAATLTKPTVAEIRAMSAASRPKLDARGRSMQATAAKIKPLANFIYRTMQVGVLLIAAGTILGGIWADYSWGRFWGWDPKEVWALITLLVYLIPLHGRFAGWFNTFALVFASVVCSLSVIMAWYGVNFVLGVGLHSYGFVEGGSQGVVLSVIGAVLALPFAAAYRRHLGSKAVLGQA